MSKMVLLAAPVVLALSAGFAPAIASDNAASREAADSYHPFTLPAQVKPAATLWDENDSPDGNYEVSNEFVDKKHAQYDSQAADDFSITPGIVWVIQEVDVSGHYFGQQSRPSDPGSSKSFSAGQTVSFYKENNDGTVGALITSIETNGTEDGFGNLAIKLGKSVRLRHGLYYISVQAKMNFKRQGYWGWATSSHQELDPALWQNPNNGYATGCTTWSKEASCVGGGPDHLFTLKGTATGH
jgi:hypothetical protein